MGGTFDDLALHENLDQKTLEDQLHSRYESKQIYTWIGDILIAINPFEDLGLYTPAVASKYSNVVRAKVPPHVFATADAAYTSATHTKQSQVVIVSGESGAGKTETTKLVVEHVLRLCSSHDSSLRTRIIQMSPVRWGRPCTAAARSSPWPLLVSVGPPCARGRLPWCGAGGAGVLGVYALAGACRLCAQ